jgi:4-carboxymuconolactone decarboxylase
VSRIPGLLPAQLDEAQAALYDAIVGGDRAKDASASLTDDDGSLIGPFNALLYSPEVGDAVQRLGAAIRFRSGLSPRTREIATLAVAAKWQSHFEWWAHEPMGRRAGITDDQLAAMKAGGEARFEDDRDQLTYDFCRAVLRTADVADPLYQAMVRDLGEPRVFELLVLVGYYSLLAQMMRIFRVGLPDGEAAVFTDEHADDSITEAD